MVVDEVMPWVKYIEFCHNVENKLTQKIPKDINSCGDCIWRFVEGPHKPLASHSGHNEDDFQRDVLAGENVLLSKRFWYFGSGERNRIVLGEVLGAMIPGRGHKSNANDPFRERFVDYFNSELLKNKIKDFGVYGEPKISPQTASEVKRRCGKEECELDAYGEEL